MMKTTSYGEIKLFAGRSCPKLAQSIADYLGMALSDWDIFDFPNENIFVKLNESIRGQDVYIIGSHNSPVHRNIMEMLIACDAVHRDSAGRITVVMPYLAYSQSDKKDQPRVPITARLMADLIETAGAHRWITIDLHSDQIQGFYKIPGDQLTAFHIITQYICDTKDLSNTVVVTPDLGFAKKGRNYAQALNVPLAFVEKRRIGNDGAKEVLTVIGDVVGKDVIIVDDLVDTAGSMLQAVKQVKARGAQSVSLAFTHPVLSDPAYERLAHPDINEIITTDTIPIPADKKLDNMTILSVAQLLGEVIKRTHEGTSVGALFDE